MGEGSHGVHPGQPPQEPRSSEEASEEETESDEALARRLQAEEQGRPVARFELLDCVEARYKDPELRGGTWSPRTTPRPSSTCSHQKPRSGRTVTCCVGTTARRTSSCSRTTNSRRPAPAEPRERDGKRGLANGLRTGAPPQEARAAVEEGRAAAQDRHRDGIGATGAGRSRRRDGRRRSPWTPEEEQHLQELVDEHGEGDWSWPTIAEEGRPGRTKEAVEERL